MPTSQDENNEHKLLLKLVRQEGLAVDEVRNLLWLINSHEHLIGFPTVFNNLYHILREMQVHCNVCLADFDIANWPALLRELLRCSPRWASEFKRPGIITKDDIEQLTQQVKKSPESDSHDAADSPSKSKRPHRMSREGFLKNGLYSMLFNIQEDKEYTRHFALLQGHLVLAHIKAMRKLSSLEQYEQHYNGEEIFGDWQHLAYESTKALRDLSKKKNINYLLKFNPFQEFKDFRTSVRKIKNPSGKSIVGYIRGYCQFIIKFGKDDIYKTRKKRGGYSSSGGGGGKTVSGHVGFYYDFGDELENDIGDPDDSSYDWGEMESQFWYDIKSDFSKDEKEALAEDVHRSELADDGEIVYTGYECEKTKKGVRNYFMSARGQLRHRKMANQLFPWDYQIMTTNEVASLINTIDKKFAIIAQLENWQKEQLLEAETMILLSIMFWTSSSLDRAVSAEYLTPATEYIKCDLALGVDVHDGKSDPEWQIRSISPKHYPNVSSAKEQTRMVVEYVSLPDLYKVREKVEILFERTNRSIESSGLVFSFKTKDFRKLINLFLGELDYGERITVAKISNYIFAQLVQECGDVATAAAITGKKHRLNNVKSFYFTPNIQYLRQIYCKVATGVGDHLGLHKPAPVSPSVEYVDVHVGAKNCLNYSDVKKAISKMREDLEALANNCPQEFVEFHNLYTIYTILFCGYASGLRAVIDPLLSDDDFFQKASLAIISDKDDRFGSKSRPVWLHPCLSEQLTCYEEHCKVIFKELAIPLGEQEAFNCFFITESRELEEVHPKRVALLFSKYFEAPANAHRRFMRTNLQEMGCPTEIIDSWMGHWATGEAPWEPYSSIALIDYFAVLQEYFSPFLDNLGWSCLKSPLVLEQCQ